MLQHSADRAISRFFAILPVVVFFVALDYWLTPAEQFSSAATRHVLAIGIIFLLFHFAQVNAQAKPKNNDKNVVTTDIVAASPLTSVSANELAAHQSVDTYEQYAASLAAILTASPAATDDTLWNGRTIALIKALPPTWRQMQECLGYTLSDNRLLIPSLPFCLAIAHGQDIRDFLYGLPGVPNALDKACEQFDWTAAKAASLVLAHPMRVRAATAIVDEAIAAKVLLRYVYWSKACEKDMDLTYLNPLLNAMDDQNAMASAKLFFEDELQAIATAGSDALRAALMDATVDRKYFDLGGD